MYKRHTNSAQPVTNSKRTQRQKSGKCLNVRAYLHKFSGPLIVLIKSPSPAACCWRSQKRKVAFFVVAYYDGLFVLENAEGASSLPRLHVLFVYLHTCACACVPVWWADCLSPYVCSCCSPFFSVLPNAAERLLSLKMIRYGWKVQTFWGASNHQTFTVSYDSVYRRGEKRGDFLWWVMFA